MRRKRSAVVLAPQEDVRKDLTAPLEKEGLEVTAMASEDSFYSYIVNRGYPSLVILSAVPERGGDRHAVLVGLRSSETRPPIVVVAGLSDREKAAALVRMGAYASVVAPLEEDEFRAVCRRALQEGAMQAEWSEVSEDLADFRAFLFPVLGRLFHAVILVDPTHTITWANDEAARTLLTEREFLVGQRLSPSFGGGFLKALEEARQTEEGWVESEVALGEGAAALKLKTRAVLLRGFSGRSTLGGLLTFIPVQDGAR